MRTIERNYRKNPHTANFLMKFHTGGNGLAADLEPTEDNGGGAATEDLLATVPVEAPAVMPSLRQQEFIVDLIREITELDAEIGRVAADYNRGMTENGRWTRNNGEVKGTISTWIDRLIAKRHELRKAAQAAVQAGGRAPMPQVADGRYAIEEEGVLRFFKVKNGNRAGMVFLDVQASDDWHSIRKLDRIRAVLTEIAKDAKAAMVKYGQELGQCGHCGRTLTSEYRKLGLGPICINK